MNTLQPHKLAGLFPGMTPEEFAGLLADVREHGVREPVVLFEGLILDGRHRYRAAQEAGVPCATVAFAGDYQAALALVVSTNLHRRHLSISQRALVAASLANMVVGGKETNSANLQNCSVEQAAAKLGVSPRSVHTARKLQHDAPELAAKVAAGEMNLNAASERQRVSMAPKVPSQADRDALHNNTLAVVDRRINPSGAPSIFGLATVADAVHREWGLLGIYCAGMYVRIPHDEDRAFYELMRSKGIEMSMEEMFAYMWFAKLDDGVRNLAVRAVPFDKGVADFRRQVEAIMGASK